MVELPAAEADKDLWKAINDAYLTDDKVAAATTPLLNYRRLLRESGSWFVPGRATSNEALAAALSPYEGLVFDEYNKLKDGIDMKPYAELARLITGMPMIYAGIVSAEHSNTLVSAGLPDDQMSQGRFERRALLCEYTIQKPKGETTQFKDIAEDWRTVNHPYNQGEGPDALRSYLGVPLTTVMGTNIGTLCCVDVEPRPDGWTPVQESGLKMIAELIMKELDLQVDRALAMKAKIVFITSINHELKTPVHGLLASAELLKTHRLAVGEDQITSFESECLGSIEHCSNTLVDVIDNVLSFASSETQPATEPSSPGHPAPVPVDAYLSSINVVQFVEQTIDSCWAGKITKGTNLKVIFNPETNNLRHALLANRGELSRIILNIFGNACKYTDTGFVLVELTGSVVCPTVDETQTIEVRITDTGRGMSQTFVQKGDLFKPFVQQDGKAEGVGLGMSIVKTFVEKNCGTLEVESELGRGTSITVRLPLRLDRAPPTSGEQREELTGKSFYMIEDNSSTACEKLNDSLRKMCEQDLGMLATSIAEADVVITQSCAEVRRLFREGSKVPCLVAASSLRSWAKDCLDEPMVHLMQLPFGPRKLYTSLCHTIKKTATTRPGKRTQRESSLSAGESHAREMPDSEESRALPGTASTADGVPVGTSTDVQTPVKRLKVDGDLNPPNRARRRPRVLCVDDNEINLRILKTVVAREKVQYDCAVNGAEAVAKFTCASPPYDLVFMDINMPVMNGFEATKSIRRWEEEHNSPESTIVALSAGGEAQRSLCLATGMSGYSEKPVSIKALAMMIQEWSPHCGED